MNSLVNKCVIIGISGGIAAYKSPALVRRLKEAGADVRVAMTSAASYFITPLTLQAVSGHTVHDTLLDSDAESGMDHIELARWADAIVIAPASANCIARLANGFADDLLTTICLATEAPVFVAPAMNQQMWQNAATQKNLSQLAEIGIRSLGTGSGDQACGEIGPGRMLEPEDIVSALSAELSGNTSEALSGINITITAGPTWEAVDPVRAITNASSGKMGYAVAQAAANAGANVTLVSGPTSLALPGNVKRIDVISAQDMLNAVETTLASTDIFIAVAAVADYRPAYEQPQKIKKHSGEMQLNLVRNPDILQHVAARKTPPFTIGFAAETENLLHHAREKLKRKGVNMIAANDVSGSNVFGKDDNSIVVIEIDNETDLGSHSKQTLARKLIELIADRYKNT